MTNSEGRSSRGGRPPHSAVFRRFAAAIQELANYGGLPQPHEARTLWDDFWHLEAHHSTAIEGNTLVLREVEALLHQGRAVGSKELKDYLEVLGYGEAARWIYAQGVAPGQWNRGELITLTEVRQVHAVALGKVWEVAPHPNATDAERPGNFRQHDIRPFAGGMTPPTHPLVPAEIGAWVDEVNAIKPQIDAGLIPVEQVPPLLAKLHVEFERIHPFLDGNGRTGRLLLNLVLIRLGWPPAIILKTQRVRYLNALDRADHGELGPLAELIARSVTDNLHRLIPNIAGPAKYVPLEALVDDQFSLVALKQAAIRGRLAAILGPDGRYRASRAALDEYRASKYTRGNRN